MPRKIVALEIDSTRNYELCYNSLASTKNVENWIYTSCLIVRSLSLCLSNSGCVALYVYK